VFGLGAKEIAEVPVPGDQVVALPAGKVKLRYVEDREGRHVGDDGVTWKGPDEDLEVTVTPSGGGAALAVKKPRMISEGSNRKTIYEEVGTVELPAQTECTISVSMSVGDEHFAPRIVVRA